MGRTDKHRFRLGVYRALLRLYPRAFFRRYGDEMTRLFEAQLDDVSGRRLAGLVLFVGAAWDAVANGAAERLREATAKLTAFAAIALALAAIGQYGLMSYSVAQRRREIGVRIALGAQPRSVSTMVIRKGMRLTLFGLVIGGLSAIWLVLLLESLLHGIQPRDPIVFTSAVTIAIATALLASYLPAARASNVDPLEALGPD